MIMKEIGTVAVLGAGQMGRGIAQVMAAHGLRVRLADTSRDHASKAKDIVATQLAKLVERGKMAAAAREEILGNILPLDLYSNLEDVDFAVEAVTERFDVKQEIFSALDQRCRPDAVLATNTSSISVTALAATVVTPARVIGMHFMNPPPLMKLVEIVRGLATSDECYAVTQALAERLGKSTIESRDIPGFVVNRILMPMLNEACFTLYEGVANVADIDVAIHLGLNHPMGPFTLMDLIGLDTTLAILQVLHHEIGDPKYRPCPLLRQYVAAGWLGRKAGRGFYVYENGVQGAPATTWGAQSRERA